MADGAMGLVLRNAFETQPRGAHYARQPDGLLRMPLAWCVTRMRASLTSPSHAYVDHDAARKTLFVADDGAEHGLFWECGSSTEFWTRGIEVAAVRGGHHRGDLSHAVGCGRRTTQCARRSTTSWRSCTTGERTCSPCCSGWTATARGRSAGRWSIADRVPSALAALRSVTGRIGKSRRVRRRWCAGDAARAGGAWDPVDSE